MVGIKRIETEEIKVKADGANILGKLEEPHRDSFGMLGERQTKMK